MAARLNTQDAKFADAFAKFLDLREEQSETVFDVVKAIVADVAEYGDNALINHTRKFDRFEATAETLQVTQEEIANAMSLCSPELLKSLKTAASRITSYSEKQLPQDLDYTDSEGVRLGHRWSAIDSVGLYVPGGTAVYPSSVLMNALPAKVAGVKKLIATMPAREGKLHPSLLAAAHIAGVDAIYKVGGAQAIAALAFGTQTIPPVDKIVGPGNAYVAEAKRQVFGRVGIDMIAGPSEILVIADNQNNPKWIAADLLSQAEHDALSQSVLMTDDKSFADRVEKEITAMLATLPRREIAAKSWDNHGAVIIVKDWQEACELCNAIAPEHLELAVEKPETLLPSIKHAGAIFLGRFTPEAVGDYVAGPSHVLPTSRTARFSSGLSVFDFLKRTSIIGCTPQALGKISDYAEVLAETEGLHAHGLSVSLRRKS
jgi:histidinol dehydrogenase